MTQLQFLPGTLRPHQGQENERGGPHLSGHTDQKSAIRPTIGNEESARTGSLGMTHSLDAHNEEHWIFVDARCGVQRLSASVHSTGDQSWVGEEDPDRVKGDGEEVSE